MSFLRMQKKPKEQNNEKIERNSVDKNVDSEQIGKSVYRRNEIFVLFYLCVYLFIGL